MKRVCKQCGKEFEIFQSEINFYKSKNLQLPKRCKECRESNKHKKPEDKESAIQEKKPVAAEQVRPLSKESEADTSALVPKMEQSNKKPGFKNKILYFAAAVLIVIFSQLFTNSPENPPAVTTESTELDTNAKLVFRSEKYLNDHYQKHGIEMGFSSAEEYQEAAAAVVNNKNALHKTEAEDGDDVYYLEDTNEFVIVSTDGYIRTYFNPDAGIDYYNRQ